MAQQKTFSITDSLKFAASSYIEHFGFILKFILIWGLIYAVLGIGYAGLLRPHFGPLFWQWYANPAAFTSATALEFIKAITPSQWGVIAGISFVFYTINLFLMTYFGYQLIQLGMGIYDGKRPTLSELFSFEGKRYFSFTGARLLYVLKVTLGTLLFVIPGIYFAFKYIFAGYSLVEGTSTTISNDTAVSAQLSDQVKVRIFLATVGIGFLVGAITGVNPFYFYVLFLVPFFSFNSVHIYKQLKGYKPQEPTSV